MIESLDIHADITASSGEHVVRIHGEGHRFIVDASSWAPLLQLRRATTDFSLKFPGRPGRQPGSITVRVRETPVLTLRIDGGRIRRRVHPIGILRSLIA